MSGYTDTLEVFVSATLAEARKRGWIIDNLNDNDKGWIVKGQAQVVITPDGGKSHYWNETEIALDIAPSLRS